MSEDERYIIDDEDREFFAEHYRAIADRLGKKRLWRGPWRVEMALGCVFKFTVQGYAKKGSLIWLEQQEEYKRAEEEMTLHDSGLEP